MLSRMRDGKLVLLWMLRKMRASSSFEQLVALDQEFLGDFIHGIYSLRRKIQMHVRRQSVEATPALVLGACALDFGPCFGLLGRGPGVVECCLGCRG